MNCKNCEKPLHEKVNYCDNCGAQVIRERIVFKKLIAELWDNAFGLDNKYFTTIKLLILRPQIILGEYLDGTRRKYIKPFAFFAIAATLSLLVFNQFSDQYTKLSGNLGGATAKVIEKQIPQQNNDSTSVTSNKKFLKETESQLQKQQELNEKIQAFLLKYFNIISFLILPFYTFLAFLVYGKPYNFGEHLVINAYLQGVSFLVTVFTFLASLFIDPVMYMATLPISMIYYTFAYGKLYELSFGRSILKLLKFILILLLLCVLIVAGGVAVGFLMKQME